MKKDVYAHIKLPQRRVLVTRPRRLALTQRRGINGMGVAQSTIN